MIVVDTSIWIDFLKGENSPEQRKLHSLINDEEDIAIVEIIFTEILQGIKEDKEFQTMKGFLLDFPIYKPKSIETYFHAAQIYRDCRKKGKTIRKTVDCIIAAICMENSLTLFHKDSDFDNIKACTGLQVMRV
ncbi:MAG: PIN domain nuclease [Nitrospirae bacterium]|nr:PIN domain nuclease [Nitrospirota bacterium]